MHGLKLKLYTYYALAIFALLLVIALFFYIPIRLFVPYRRQIHYVYAVNRGIMMAWAPLAGFRFKTENAHLADRSKTYIVVMNHQNLLDMFGCARMLKIPAKPLLKRELLGIPILGWLFSMAGLAVSRQSSESRRATYQAMIDEVEKGISILIFPEGTRNRTDQPLIGFKDGAFRLSLETGVPVLPVVVMNTRDKSGPDTVIFRPSKVILRFLEPLDPALFEGSAEKLSDHCHMAMESAILENDPCFKTK